MSGSTISHSPWAPVSGRSVPPRVGVTPPRSAVIHVRQALSLFAQVGVVAGDRERVAEPAGWSGLAELAEREGVLDRSLLALVTAGAPRGQEFVEQVGDGLLDRLGQ